MTLRVLATVLFWSAGIAGLINFAQLKDKVRSVGLPFEAVLAAGVIALQLIGSAVMVFNPGGLAWLGPVALAAFTLLTIPYGHAFWTFEEPRKSEEMYIAIEHLTVVGCLLAIGFYSAA